jgi:hypothetical protein
MGQGKLNCLGWHGSAKGKEKQEVLKTKYGQKSLLDLKTQRAVYWLSIDQIIPPTLLFREDLGIRHDIEWQSVDQIKIFSDSRMQDFQWRSTHGKLYARKDLLRLHYVQDQMCTQCSAPIKSVRQVYLECPRNVILFSNFEKQYKLENKLSECEKLIGFNTNIERSKLQLKQLNILRKCMYDAVHAQVILKWEEVLKSVDNMYIIEYAIAEKSDQIAKHLKNWEL